MSGGGVCGSAKKGVHQSVIIGDVHCKAGAYELVYENYEILRILGYSNFILERARAKDSIDLDISDVSIQYRNAIAAREFCKTLNLTGLWDWSTLPAQLAKLEETYSEKLNATAKVWGCTAQEIMHYAGRVEAFAGQLKLLQAIKGDGGAIAHFAQALKSGLIEAVTEEYMLRTEDNYANILAARPSVAVVGCLHVPGIKKYLCEKGVAEITVMPREVTLHYKELRVGMVCSIDDGFDALLKHLRMKDQGYLNACALGRVDVVLRLIAAGADTHVVDEKGRNASHYVAMRRGRLGSGLLLDKYLSCVGRDLEDADMEALLAGRLSVMSVLLEHNVDFDAKNTNGNTARQLLKRQAREPGSLAEKKDQLGYGVLVELLSLHVPRTGNLGFACDELTPLIDKIENTTTLVQTEELPIFSLSTSTRSAGRILPPITDATTFLGAPEPRCQPLRYALLGSLCTTTTDTEQLAASLFGMASP